VTFRCSARGSLGISLTPLFVKNRRSVKFRRTGRFYLGLYMKKNLKAYIFSLIAALSVSVIGNTSYAVPDQQGLDDLNACLERAQNSYEALIRRCKNIKEERSKNQCIMIAEHLLGTAVIQCLNEF